MTCTECLTERAITFAIAETDEELAVARLAFLAQDDHAALDAAIDACLARTERSLYTRWRAISFLVRVRYEDKPTPEQRPLPAPAARTAARVGPRELPGARPTTSRTAARRAEHQPRPADSPGLPAQRSIEAHPTTLAAGSCRRR
jgi:hypothetical protein